MNILNPELVEKQQLTPEKIELLENLHFVINNHKNRPIEDIKNIQEYVALIKEIEFAMQRLWGFEENADYHTHWYTDPKCSCPILDNNERRGTDSFITSQSCKLHGWRDNDGELI